VSEHTPLTEAQRAELQALLGDVPLGTNTAVRKWAERILAARTSTATADTGLRERVEALAAGWDESSAGGHPDCDIDADCMACAAAELRAILDATTAPTTDAGARDAR